MNKLQTRSYDNWRFLVTSKCNSNCFFCHRDGAGINNSFLNFYSFDKIVKKYGDGIQKVRFAGGEPLLHPDIFKMIRRVLFITQDISVVTNGILLSKYIRQIKSLKLPKITVSLHSLNPEIYKKITGVGFKQYHDIIIAIKEFKKNIKIKLNVIILKNLNTNKEELQKLLNFVIKNNFDMEFIELDLGSIQNFGFEKYHYAPNQLMNRIRKIIKIPFKFDALECNWISIIKKSKIEIHKALCFNKLCNECIAKRPILVYPDGKIDRCRLGKALIKNINKNL